MRDRLFAYGTLLVPELFRAVVGREIPGRAATLHGYGCYRVRRAPYPAIVPQSSGIVHGQIYRGIQDREWAYLDDFESRLYERIEAEIIDDEQGPTSAYTYVFAPEFHDRLTDESWDIENFRTKHLSRYLDRL